MKRIVTFSGGVSSWAAAKRVVERYGSAEVTLLFADTRMEDEDLYRFIVQAAGNVGAPLVVIADGRTPWDVFRDERFLGNSRADPCSKILKRQLLDRWLSENCDPDSTVVYSGIDFTEVHRHENLRDRRAAMGWTYEAPLCEAPLLDKVQQLAWLRAEGVAAPRLYMMGFSHNNCGGFCVKAGHGHFALLLAAMPERYACHEQRERDLRAALGDVSILTDRRGDGRKKPLTLEEFRLRIEGGYKPDPYEIGGCGCAVDDTVAGAVLEGEVKHG